MKDLDKKRIFHYIWWEAMTKVKFDPKASPDFDFSFSPFQNC
jgi:hypothetical protein